MLTSFLRPPVGEHGTDVAIAHGLLSEGEGAVLLHFAGGAEKSAEGSARKSAADADALDAERRQFRQGELDTLQSHQDIDRAIDRSDHSGDVVFGSEAGSIEHISTGFLISLETTDGVF